VTGPAIDLERLRAIVEDPKKASALPPTLVAHIKMDLAPKDVTSAVSPPVEMATKGITPKLQEGNQGPVSDAVQRYISPINYRWGMENFHDNWPAMAKMMLGINTPITGEPDDRNTGYRPKAPQQAQEDSWNLYLGKPQSGRSFSVSPFKPTHAKDSSVEYVRPTNFLAKWMVHKAKETGDKPSQILSNLVETTVREGGKIPMNDDDMSVGPTAQMYGVMQNFQVSHGHDEVGPYLAVYDIWDLHHAGANLVGKPFEIYDRLYYDPKKMVPIPESEVLAKKAKLDLRDPKNQEEVRAWLTKQKQVNFQNR
jgi:hypothetical protein